MLSRLFPSPWSIVLACLLTTPLQAQETLPFVELATVIESEVGSGHRVVGSVVPLRTSTIGSAVAGRVKQFKVSQGHAVLAGQAVAELMTETLRIELRAAKAELELYQQQLIELQNGSRIEEIAESEANAMGAKAAMENASSQLKRMQVLSASRAATEADLENARERARFTQYAYAAADALLKRVQAGPRDEQIAQAQARLDLQRHNVELIEDRIAKHTIIAPFDGFISAEYTQVGAWIGSGDPIVQVIQLDQIEVQAQVTGEYATNLRRGDIVRVEFPELPEELLLGTIDRIVPVADSRSRTFPVMIRMANRFRDGEPLLMAGMLARVDLAVGSKKSMPFVPKDALVLNERERAVFVFEPDSSGSSGTVSRVPVELGVALEGMIQVHGDLRDGQLVVVIGNERLASGARVKVIKQSISEVPAG
jgi:HlyD family secretion protein